MKGRPKTGATQRFPSATPSTTPSFTPARGAQLNIATIIRLQVGWVKCNVTHHSEAVDFGIGPMQATGSMPLISGWLWSCTRRNAPTAGAAGLVGFVTLHPPHRGSFNNIFEDVRDTTHSGP
jgi:hypothetical protein